MTTLRTRLLTNAASNGAAELKAALLAIGVSTSIVRNDRPPRARLTSDRRTIKWGSFTRSIDVADEDNIVNNHAGQASLNKKRCFELLRTAGVPIPEFTTERSVAETWIRAGFRTYERHSLTGSAGEGIVVAETLGELSDTAAPLYTQGVKGKRREYRIHVFNLNGVQRVFIQQKLRREGFAENPSYSSTVRNLENGWIFANQNIVAPRQATIDAAVAACRALNLNFGGVDLIEQEKTNGFSVVLEINTAPGLAGATVNFYAESIKAALQEEGAN